MALYARDLNAVESCPDERHDELSSVCKTSGILATMLGTRRRTFHAMAPIGAFILLSVLFATTVGIKGHDTNVGLFLGRRLSDISHCADYKRFRLKTLRSNLGELGPGIGEPEGIVYEASEYGDASASPMLLHVNVIGQNDDGSYIYTPAYPQDNGIYGQFGDINQLGGNNVTLRFTVTDLSATPITIPELDITFFDLDIGVSQGKNTTEAITIHPGWTAVHISSETQLLPLDHGDGSRTYKATMLGRKRDSPSDPEVLSAWQFNKAVTVRYDNFQTADVTLHAYGPGRSGRYFNFILEPTILCVDAGVKPETILAAATTVAPVEEGKCCLISIGPVELVCTAPESKSWYHFMCTEGSVEPAPTPVATTVAPVEEGNTTVAPVEEGKCCLISIGPVEFVCTAPESKSWYHFMCAEGSVEPAPTAAPTPARALADEGATCCIVNAGPVVFGCVPKEEKKFYHFACSE